jgi:cyclopropane fatty-acyl-phospholipid synthase-like methyltransferase
MAQSFRQLVKSIPIAGSVAVNISRGWKRMKFTTSSTYWEGRYAAGGNSGAGSYGRLAEFKTETINALIEKLKIKSVAEFGCGDGNQLRFAKYPQYTGYDVSDTAVATCRRTFHDQKNWRFFNVTAYDLEKFDLSMSIDVVFHLVEDDVFEAYMDRLFSASDKYVLIYSNNFADRTFDGVHVKTRQFSEWISLNRTNWNLIDHIKNKFPYEINNPDTSFCDFYLYARNG